MSNLLFLSSISNFFNRIGNAVIYLLVAIGVVVCLVIMARFPGTRKILFYVISSVVIIIGIYSTGSFIKEVNMQGYVNGDIQLINTIKKDNFYYSSNSIVFTLDEDTGLYTYENSFVPTEFDGEHEFYNVEFNEYILFDSKITAGAIYSVVNMDFRNELGEIVDNGDMNLTLKYLSDKTSLKLTTKDKKHASYLEKHFKDYGFRIKVYLKEV